MKLLLRALKETLHTPPNEFERGYYNGIEQVVSALEVREPKYITSTEDGDGVQAAHRFVALALQETALFKDSLTHTVISRLFKEASHV